jgi:hypothetical protein
VSKKTLIAAALMASRINQVDNVYPWVAEDHERFKKYCDEPSMLDVDDDEFLAMVLEYNSDCNIINSKLTNRQAPRKGSRQVKK